MSGNMAHVIVESEIRQRLDKLVEAIRAMDLDSVMSLYAPDIVSFDIEPPLKHTGAEAKKRNWAKVFLIYQRPLDYVLHDLAIVVGGEDVAFGQGLVRISGALKNGNTTEHRFRLTTCFRWQLADRARPCVGAARSRERQSAGESRAMIRTRKG
jgi:ketosteroid isomerase-like protein